MREPEAYQAMFRFLDERYNRLPSDGLGQLLSEMQLAEDGKPFDPAIVQEWADAIAAVEHAKRPQIVERQRRAG